MTDAELKVLAEAIVADDRRVFWPSHGDAVVVAEAYLALLAKEAARTATFTAHDELLAHATEIEERLDEAESERDALLAKEAARGEVLPACPRCRDFDNQFAIAAGGAGCQSCGFRYVTAIYFQLVSAPDPA